MPLFPSFFEEIEKKPNYRLSDRSAGTAQTQYDTNRRRASKCEEFGWKKERKAWRQDKKELQVARLLESNLPTTDPQPAWIVRPSKDEPRCQSRMTKP